MSPNDSGEESGVAQPPVARSRPGRPTAAARRASNKHDAEPGPTPRPRGQARPANATTIVEPSPGDALDESTDDTLESERPAVAAPDPLLQARVAHRLDDPDGGSNGHGKSTGTKSGNGKGTRSGNGPANRNGNGNGTGTAGRTRDTTRRPARRVGSNGDGAGMVSSRSGEPIEVAAVETATEPIEAAAVEVAPTEERIEVPVEDTTEVTVEDTTEVTVEDTLPATTGDGAGAEAPPEAGVAPEEVAAEALAPPAPGEPSTAPESEQGDSTEPREASRWSLRKLLDKVMTGPVPVADLAAPNPPDAGTLPGETTPPVARSGSPITSPIPVQPPPEVEGRAGEGDQPRPLGEPLGLLPKQPPYIRPTPTPTTGHGPFRSGPIELDPALDPDRPQRAPRLKSVNVTALRRRGRPRLRRVTRVVRHIDPWSVFKVALCFSLVLYGVCLTAGVLLWNVAYTTGTIDNVQRFFESFGWDTFRFKGGEIFHNAWIAGLFCAIGLTGLIVLAATLFNLITDLVGGIRVTVLEEEVIERDPAERRTLLRRAGARPTNMVPSPERDETESLELCEHLG